MTELKSYADLLTELTALREENERLKGGMKDIRDRLCRPFKQKYPLMNTHLATIRDRVDAALSPAQEQTK